MVLLGKEVGEIPFIIGNRSGYWVFLVISFFEPIIEAPHNEEDNTSIHIRKLFYVSVRKHGSWSKSHPIVDTSSISVKICVECVDDSVEFSFLFLHIFNQHGWCIISDDRDIWRLWFIWKDGIPTIGLTLLM